MLLPYTTLSRELVLDADAYFQSNTTLIFEPGAYYLNFTVLKVGDLSSVHFKTSDIPSNVRIVCGYSNFHLYNITAVYIRGVDLISN